MTGSIDFSIQVNGIEAFPAAGMLFMAIEAVKQLKADKQCTGYHLRDVSFNRALLVPSTPEGVETQLLVGPTSGAHSNVLWTEFKLYAYEGEQWDEVCRGAISVDSVENQSKDTNHHREHLLEMQSYRKTFEDGHRKCKMAMTSKRLYEIFSKNGLQYGPQFQNLKRIYFDERGHAFGAVSSVQQNQTQRHIIHPTTLDSIFQLGFPALTAGGKHLIPTMVPVKVHKLWLSNLVQDLPSTQDTKIFVSATFEGFRNARFSIIAVDETHNPLMVVDLEATLIAGDESLAASQIDQIQRFYNLVWEPDLELLDKSEAEVFSTSSFPPRPLKEVLIDEKEAACLLVIQSLVQEIGTGDLAEPLYIRKYYEWMQHRCKTHSAILSRYDAAGSNARASHKVEEILNMLENHDVEGRMIARVARNLKQILTGNLDALGLLFNDSLLQEYYHKAHDAPYVLQRIRTYVDAMTHKNPGLKVLEIGAGTGSATVSLVDNTKHDLRFSEYAFTDISPSFFEKAKERFNSECMVFKTLDIESDPLKQGFEAGKYDLVIASSVNDYLHLILLR